MLQSCNWILWSDSVCKQSQRWAVSVCSRSRSGYERKLRRLAGSTLSCSIRDPEATDSAKELPLSLIQEVPWSLTSVSFCMTVTCITDGQRAGLLPRSAEWVAHCKVDRKAIGGEKIFYVSRKFQVLRNSCLLKRENLTAPFVAFHNKLNAFVFGTYNMARTQLLLLVAVQQTVSQYWDQTPSKAAVKCNGRSLLSFDSLFHNKKWFE